jgi:geranylgeranyl transferase type-1 subunit beta
LSLLGALGPNNDNDTTYGVHKEQIIDWVYNLQIKLPKEDDDDTIWKYAGFQGSTCVGNSDLCTKGNSIVHPYTHFCQGHLAMTYSALCILKVLGDDFSRLENPRDITRAMKSLQLENGSFSSTHNGSENDMRFVYCACAISFMLNDWDGVDVDKTVGYIRFCRTWDGAISLSPGLEGHGGSVFCAVASLHLMGKLHQVLEEDDWKEALIHWCVSRQVRGMQGRPNKNEDTCYSYWIGGALRLLQSDNLLDKDALTSFVLSCQTQMGGFSKLIGGIYPDVLHSFYSLAWLSLAAEDPSTHGTNNISCHCQLHPFDCALGIARN